MDGTTFRSSFDTVGAVSHLFTIHDGSVVILWLMNEVASVVESIV